MPRRPSILFHHWKAKLGSLALAIVLWLVIHQSINRATPPAHAAPGNTEAVPKE